MHAPISPDRDPEKAPNKGLCATRVRCYVEGTRNSGQPLQDCCLISRAGWRPMRREYLRKLPATRHSISARLLIGILLFSTFVTLALAGIRALHRLSARCSGNPVKTRPDRQELSGQPGKNSWTLDETQLQLQLMGILQQADIRAAEVRDTGISIKPLVVQVGETPEPPVVTRDYPLTHLVQGQDRMIGTLRVEATLADAYRRLTDIAARVFATQATEIFLVALFIIFFFNYLVTRHLSAIAAQVGSYRLYRLALGVVLEAPSTAARRRNAAGNHRLQLFISQPACCLSRPCRTRVADPVLGRCQHHRRLHLAARWPDA